MAVLIEYASSEGYDIGRHSFATRTHKKRNKDTAQNIGNWPCWITARMFKNGSTHMRSYLTFFPLKRFNIPSSIPFLANIVKWFS